MVDYLEFYAIQIAVLIVLSNYATLTQACVWSKKTLEIVSVCPTTEEATQEAARIKKCDGLSWKQNCTKPSSFKYHCLYSYPIRKLVEVCAAETSVDGGCLMYDTTLSKIQHLYNVECGDSSTTCADTYMSTDAHLLAPCPKLENMTFENTSPTNNTPQDTNYWIIGVSSAIVIIILIIVSVSIINCYRRRTELIIRSSQVQGRDECELGSLLMDELVKELGKYAVWRTSISDKFPDLSDDEVCVLFCFLCSDSGTPDFTDTDWLDILNAIRQWVYGKDRVTSVEYSVTSEEYSVTREEAQRTLDGLKSRGFLWDPNRLHLSEDAKDESMYRVTGRAMSSGRMYPVYYLSNYTTAVRYLRLRGYTRKSGEKCIISNNQYSDTLLIRRLQMNILTHVTMEDTGIYDEVSQYLNIPPDKVRMGKSKRGTFIEELKQTGKCVQYRGGSQGSVQHVNWLWRYDRHDIVRSCIGLHPHCDVYIINNTAYRKHSQYHDRPPAERCLLYCLLMVDDYTVKVKDESHIKVYNAIRERYFTDLPVCEEISVPQNLERIIHVENDMIKFKSDGIRHDVMYAFVAECLLKDSDLKFFLTTGSSNVISEYCRSWGYKRSEEERCLYIPDIPDKMYELFIDRLQLDILTHCTVSDRGIRDRISQRLRVPMEVFSWDNDAKKRYVKSSKEQGRKRMFYARGMLVGCAGAGKTTLLIKLQNKESANDEIPTETTVGLEVHDNLFEIESGILKDHKETSSVLDSDKQLISMTDFAGQVVYYACHQVYLSRRAIYLLVMDMSKDLKEEVHLHNRDRHDPLGSLFHNWTYLDYFIFWLQCIKTYCDVGKRRVRRRETEQDGDSNPVIIIASHKDQIDEGKEKANMSNFYWKLRNSLPDGLACLNLLSSDRYFEVGCPPTTLNDQQRIAIENIKQCIVETVTQMPHWGEEIPSNWIKFVGILNKKKEKGIRILKRDELRKMEELGFSTEEDLDDMLRFFQEIGHIIYFGDEKLRDTVIINVQWFVDAFKHIITDRKHVPPENMVCDKWIQTGRIPESAFHKIWKDSKDNSYIGHQYDILPYMQKLGLITQKLTDSVTKENMYYVPSMNRVDVSPECLEVINKGHKTSILVFHFKTYLPHFFFFRLVVHCSAKWEELNPTMFCKNAAFYKTRDYSHCIAISVNTTSILLQVFTPGKNTNLKTENVIGIRREVKNCVKNITQTFHEQVEYEIGYSCEDVPITDVEESHFLSEDQVLTFGDIVTCPNHFLGERSHDINKRALIGFWGSGV